MAKINDQQAEYFINRELSWLEFNDRVLQEARNSKNPLFERLKFLAIVSSNLDEFFMIRVASLKHQVHVGFQKPDPSGLSPKQQLKKISLRTHKMVDEQYTSFQRALVPGLKRNDISIVNRENLTASQRDYLETYFTEVVYPVLTPMAVDSSRPFPLILNKSLNLGILIENKSSEKDYTFATVQAPSVLPRMVSLPTERPESKSFIFLEEIVAMFIQRLFTGHKVICAYPYRITRDADLSIQEEEAEDLLMEIEKSLKKRKWGSAIRLEVDFEMDERLVHILKTVLEIHHGDIYYINGPIDLTFLMKMYNLEGYDGLKYLPYVPQTPLALLEGENIFQTIHKGDILMHHPFESFEPVVEFIHRAAADPKVLAIKQTLYRVSGDSPIVKALAEAAERGKQVTVLVEVKARFDEENNIQWAKRLEQSGCHVIYGLVGLKTHCKITLVVRMESDGVRRYVHLGTGNYNDITAKFYTDLGLFTCNAYYGADASALFNMLSGYSETPGWYRLEAAPKGLRKRFIQLIENEIKNAIDGKNARIVAKMNSLVDTELIMLLYKASIAGVKIDLIIRGICCLKPGLSGVSENITVRSIVGRFLEHSRIFYFYNNGREDVFLSSADWMPRNLDRRVELLFPVESKELRQQVIKILALNLEDTVKARLLNSEGKYKKIDRRGKGWIDSQNYFCEVAHHTTKRYNEEKTTSIFQPVLSNHSALHQEIAVDREEE
ncbi:polyphosphate kinase [Anaerosolibacter carboniphilus]|uniref:Polyphosphate kinase n=1 Tax=Anaerosolibacter carboniphilus TaxID=1417629 RepID=A0A841L9M6_9FIRM|nr:RNA degradosome polyphosphate kinase [Anaerosolibacter carboniphilus]MBB6218945.1 polyphosphate kinase [Anaerosolibacter carboniphilus]